MSKGWHRLVFIAAAFNFGIAGAAEDSAKQWLEHGKQEYLARCAGCHGESGVGAGDSNEALTRTPADLTTYARRNGGVFPRELAWLAIDGRTLNDSVQRHRVMPIWGQDYRNEALANPTYRAPEKHVSERIAALVDYIATLQVK